MTAWHPQLHIPNASPLVLRRFCTQNGVVFRLNDYISNQGEGGVGGHIEKICPSRSKTINLISQVFIRKFQQININSVSGHWLPFVLKICQTVAGICMTSQFHEILNNIFGGFLHFGPTMGRPYPTQMYSVSTVPAIPKARRMHARFSFSFAHVSTCRISYTNLKIIELDFGFGFLSF